MKQDDGEIRAYGEGMKGLQKPSVCKGEQNVHAEWKATLLAYVRGVVHRNVDQWIERAVGQGQSNVEDNLDVAFGRATEEIKALSLTLHAQLVSNTTNHVFQLAHGCPRGSGL